MSRLHLGVDVSQFSFLVEKQKSQRSFQFLIPMGIINCYSSTFCGSSERHDENNKISKQQFRYTPIMLAQLTICPKN